MTSYIMKHTSPATSVQVTDAAFSPAQFEVISGSTKFTIPRIAP